MTPDRSPPGPVDLGVGSGVGRILLALGSKGTGTEVLKTISQFGSVPSGTQVTSASVRSSGGGFVNVAKATTTAEVDATITVAIGAGAKVTTGGDFVLNTDALGFATADSTNGGGGFIAIGASQANASVKVTTDVTLGDQCGRDGRLERRHHLRHPRRRAHRQLGEGRRPRAPASTRSRSPRRSSTPTC